MTYRANDLHRAMDEALNVKIERVERPTPVKGVTETWLHATYRGKHVGWLPANTDMNTAILKARTWLKGNRRIAAAARKIATPSAAGTIATALTS